MFLAFRLYLGHEPGVSILLAISAIANKDICALKQRERP